MSENAVESGFDPSKHMIQVQGGRQYLPVAARVMWFRKEHPDWGIVTDPMELNIEAGYAIFRTTLFNEAGRIISTATKFCDRRGFADFIGKAESGSVGRALALAGYGTQDALDEEGDGPNPETVNNPGRLNRPYNPQGGPPRTMDPPTYQRPPTHPQSTRPTQTPRRPVQGGVDTGKVDYTPEVLTAYENPPKSKEIG